ncbi:MAG: pyrimidine/purine nucleoside phosphorylase [Pseudomonadales bacterium]|nr:pyrimidine/purine nucleoside phosphorylase [Pseudomonadales bacterium]
MLEVNSYFDGNVKSIGFDAGPLPATVGVMKPGDYTFGTDKFETMTVVRGVLIVQLPGSDEWKEFKDGDTFEVDANKEFQLKVKVDTAYLCTYGK